MPDAYLSLGGNLGDRAATVADAIRRIGDVSGIRIIAVSPAYRTAPVGPVAQDWFLNLAVAIATDLAPEALVATCLAIEAAMGRDRVNGVRWGPRLIDIDVILYGAFEIQTEAVEIPHPRFQERAFVLVPLADIAPDFVFRGQTLAAMAAAMDRTGIERIG